MSQIFYFVLIMLLHFFVFLAFGTLFFHLIKWEDATISMAIIAGFFLYFLLFNVIAVPMKLMKFSLTGLAGVMAVLIVLVTAASCYKGRGFWRRQMKTMPAVVKEHSYMLLIIGAAVGFQALYVAVFYNGNADAAYYVGEAAAAVYTNTMGQIDPHTGLELKYFASRYVFSAYPMHNAVVSVWTGVPVIIQAKTIMAVINVVLSNMICYQTAKLLFQKKSVKYADLMLFFIFLINALCNTPFLPSAFLFNRIFEGKAMLANIVFPMSVYGSICYCQAPQDRKWWIMMLLSNGAAVCFSGSCYMAVFSCSAVVLPLMIGRKQWNQLRYYIVAILPIIVWMAAYIMVKLRIISMRI